MNVQDAVLEVTQRALDIVRESQDMSISLKARQELTAAVSRFFNACVMKHGELHPTEPMVTYAHQNDNGEGIRFRQYKKDPLPPWAVDVRDETPDREDVGHG